eukprot:6201402-Pleurochrysis_carterae.AAC.2
MWTLGAVAHELRRFSTSRFKRYMRSFRQRSCCWTSMQHEDGTAARAEMATQFGKITALGGHGGAALRRSVATRTRGGRGSCRRGGRLPAASARARCWPRTPRSPSAARRLG